MERDNKRLQKELSLYKKQKPPAPILLREKAPPKDPKTPYWIYLAALCSIAAIATLQLLTRQARC